MDINTQKTRARLQAKARRATVQAPISAAIELIKHAPISLFKGKNIGGIWPLPGEIDTRPLMQALSSMGINLSLPCTPRKGHPLTFRAWAPKAPLKAGPYGTKEPSPEAPIVYPDLVLVPLLAFTNSGDRLGYGGGFYDRTLSALADHFESDPKKSLVTCGIAFDIQRAKTLPIGEYDQALDGVLTEHGYTDFKYALGNTV